MSWLSAIRLGHPAKGLHHVEHPLAASRHEEVRQKWAEHSTRVASGEIARMRGKSIHVSEPIDKVLRDEFESFLNAAVRALKQGMQKLLKTLNVDIGCLYKKQKAFEAGIATLQKRDPLLAEYLRQSRTWSEVLIGRRNALEHEGWTLPRVSYSAAGARITALEPTVDGRPLCEFVTSFLDRLLCFAEDATAHCLLILLPSEITITEIPIGQRVPEAPERFAPTLSVGGLPPWRIEHHAFPLDDT